MEKTKTTSERVAAGLMPECRCRAAAAPHGHCDRCRALVDISLARAGARILCESCTAAAPPAPRCDICALMGRSRAATHEVAFRLSAKPYRVCAEDAAEMIKADPTRWSRAMPEAR